ncbi:DUF883 family protein [Aquisalinus flavus]|uniref:DUF883 domain-containing protein n=1 Tax=Aquisalinus flavus TaxID=1526572 RepID=A0A8J2V1F3_9PROT|nr:DUF883 family protein [Aquisalinus flavus]MBD0427032.1 DUF883 family protein [Aquisalinus flavus]UNE46858.1 DUF883 family protein [Aquisalinus flavus]GGC97826.1 hypothetical protein GCM10011342_03460 [Aquisalinus flavus]
MAFTDKLSTKNDEDLASMLKELRGDLENLRKDMHTLQKDAGKFGSASMHNAQHKVEDATEKAIKMGRDKAKKFKHEAEEQTESLRDTVRENPVASLGLAVAAGMILGRTILK